MFLLYNSLEQSGKIVSQVFHELEFESLEDAIEVVYEAIKKDVEELDITGIIPIVSINNLNGITISLINDSIKVVKNIVIFEKRKTIEINRLKDVDIIDKVLYNLPNAQRESVEEILETITEIFENE